MSEIVISSAGNIVSEALCKHFLSKKWVVYVLSETNPSVKNAIWYPAKLTEELPYTYMLSRHPIIHTVSPDQNAETSRTVLRRLLQTNPKRPFVHISTVSPLHHIPGSSDNPTSDMNFAHLLEEEVLSSTNQRTFKPIILRTGLLPTSTIKTSLLLKTVDRNMWRKYRTVKIFNISQES